MIEQLCRLSLRSYSLPKEPHHLKLPWYRCSEALEEGHERGIVKQGLGE